MERTSHPKKLLRMHSVHRSRKLS